MATVDSTPSIRELISVFGGGNSLRDFYRGGPLVPNIPQNGDVSTNPGSLRLRQFIGASSQAPLEVSISPPSVTDFTNTGSGTTESVTASTSGGPSGSVSWDWDFISGDTNFSINSTTNATVWWNYSGVTPGTTKSSTWRARATKGGQSATQNITVKATNIF